jgi:hypothetical protein
MMDQTQTALEIEMQHCAHLRASDPACPVAIADITCVFDLGSSGGSNIARNKDSMIAEAFQFARWNTRLG